MSTLKEAFDKKRGEGVPLLKGSDLDKKESSVVIKVKDFREAPENFSGIAIIIKFIKSKVFHVDIG